MNLLRSRQQALTLFLVALQWWTARSRLGESAVVEAVASERSSGVIADVSSMMVNRGVFESDVATTSRDDEGEEDRKKNHSWWAGGAFVEHGWGQNEYGHDDEDYGPKFMDDVGGKKKEDRGHDVVGDTFSPRPSMGMDLHRNERRSSSSLSSMPVARPTRAPRVVFTGWTPTTTTTTITTTKRQSSSVGKILSRAPVSKRRSSSVDNTLARAPVAHPTQPPVISDREL